MYSITCDNEANIVKMVHIFNDEEETHFELFEIDDINT